MRAASAFPTNGIFLSDVLVLRLYPSLGLIQMYGISSSSFMSSGFNPKISLTLAPVSAIAMITERSLSFKSFRFGSNLFSTKEASKGSGFGLYNSKLFIEDHNGRIGFISEEGKGSSFFLFIPLFINEVSKKKNLQKARRATREFVKTRKAIRPDS